MMKRSQCARPSCRALRLQVSARNMIIFHPQEVSKEGYVSLRPSDPRAVHVNTVLGLSQKGSTFRAGVIGGGPRVARVSPQPPPPQGAATTAGLAVQLFSAGAQPTTPVPAELTILLACPRPKVFRRLLAPLASVGVRRVVVTAAEKVEGAYFASGLVSDGDAVGEEILRGLEQAGDTQPPEIWLSRKALRPALNLLNQLEEVDTLGSAERLPWGVSKLDLFQRPITFGPPVPKEKQAARPSAGPSDESTTPIADPSQDGPCGNPRRRKDSAPGDPVALVSGGSSVSEDSPASGAPFPSLRILADPSGTISLLEAVQAAAAACSSGTNSAARIGPDGSSPLRPEAAASASGPQQGGQLEARGPLRVTMAVGPEGGWTPEEISLLEGYGYRKVSVGSRPLTTEVFVQAASAMVLEAARVGSGGGR